MVDSHILETNPAMERMTGLRTVSGRRIRDVLPDLESSWFGRLERVFTTGRAERFEDHIAALDRWFDVHLGRLGGEGSRRIVGVYRDITERKRREHHAAFLDELSQALALDDRPDEIVRATGERLGAHLGIEFLNVCDVKLADGNDPAEARFTVAYAWEREGLPGPRSTDRAGDALSPEFLRAARAGETIVIRDTDTDPRVDAGTYRVIGMRAFVAVPILQGGAWPGLVSAFTPTPRDWRPDEAQLIAEVAHRVFLRIERARADEALRRFEARQTYLLTLGDALRPLDDPLDIQRTAMRVLGEHLGADRVLYAEIAPDDRQFVIADNYARANVPKMIGRFPLSDYDHAQNSQRRGETLVLPDIRSAGESDEHAAFLAIGVEAIIGMPLHKGGRWVASLSVHHGRPRAWSPEDTALVGETAERTWAAVERARAEAALARSEAEYRTLFNSMDEGFTVVEVLFQEGQASDYRFLEINAAFAHHTGFVGAKGKTARELVPDLEMHWMKTYEQVALSGKPVRFENTVDAIGRVLDVNAFRVGAAGEHRVALLFTDITERKQVETALRESEERLRALIENLPGGAVFVVDRDLRYQVAEGEALTSAGMNAGQYVGHTVAEVVIPELARVYEAHYRQALAGQPFELEHDQGGASYVTRGVPLRGPAGEVTAALTVSYDITDRKRAEVALRASEERFRAVANLVPDLLWESEPDGSTTWYNGRWLAYTGQTAEQATGWGWVDAIHPGDRDASTQRYRQAAAAGQSLRQEHRLRRRDGEYRWFAVDTVPVKGERGETIKFYGAATDVHELHTLNTRLEAQVERRTRRLADLNSELRALATASSQELIEPLRRLRSVLGLLERRISAHLDEPARKWLAMMQNEAQRAEVLSENFRSLAQLEQRDLKWGVVALAPLVVQVRSDLAPGLGPRTGRWTVGELPVVNGDSLLLRQAFSDLIHHALSVVPPGREAHVEVAAAASGLPVTVDVWPLAPGTANFETDGVVNARRIVQRHGGTLGVTLQGERVRFELHLPGRQP
ncbi:hypothetical protein CVO96_19850 [Deinococcus koreensis]|uniref:histidine kinase n=1 Tax=Deinococcus koreensis TaxID=2054903 RepID=A0A2K3US76_9DEIO|nr:hypothetical protein CVO96_19850 [Deinococcus koreensis]